MRGEAERSPGVHVVWHRQLVSREMREKLHGHRGMVVWFTGLSGSGKSTLAHAVEKRMHDLGCSTFVFDGDNVRHGLCSDLGFSDEDRSENIRRISEMLALFVEAGILALAAFISPFAKDRQMVRDRVGRDRFVEIYCRCPVEVCEERDVKGLYKKARAGEIRDYTGISSPYEEPVSPDLVVDTAETSLPDSVDMVVGLLAGMVGDLGSMGGNSDER